MQILLPFAAEFTALPTKVTQVKQTPSDSRAFGSNL
jgi:hypothetical protein